jgi:hypothetical protein
VAIARSCSLEAALEDPVLKVPHSGPLRYK